MSLFACQYILTLRSDPMKLAISNLPYQGLFTNRLMKLPLDLGIEVYSETGSDFYWEHLLPKLMKDRSGPFSVHGPYQNIDLSLPELDYEPVRALYEWTYRLCRDYGSAHCVCHPYAYVPRSRMSAEEQKERRKVCLERVKDLNQLAEQYGVALLVENMPNKDGLLNQDEFIELFGSQPELRFLIDTGHANIQGWDIEKMFEALGKRILGYHINDNFGEEDSHLPVFEGTFNWDLFFTKAAAITPDATYVCEYMHGTVDELTASAQRIQEVYEKYLNY